jgi:putative ATP-binding cassette transporter
MSSQDILIDRQTVERFFRAIRMFLSSELGGKAKLMFVGLIALLLGSNGMNVLNNYVGRDFMTAIENRNQAGFVRLAFVYLGVFAGSTSISVFAKVMEDRLGLLWREFITKRIIDIYLSEGTYYRLDNSGELDNPDQRIAEDVRAFTVTTLSFVVVILNSSLTILAFSGVVWSISPLLFGVAVVYAACGSFMIFKLGRPLIGLNYRQLDMDANFRSTLIHVGENAEPLLLAHREGRLRQRLLSRFDKVAENIREVIKVNRNLGFFTGGYYWLIGLIPTLLVAPDFMAGKIEFGVVTQAGMAFSILVGAFSVVVSQFQSISTFAAVIARLESLYEALEPVQKPDAAVAVEIAEDQSRVAYEGLSLRSAQTGGALLEELSVSIPAGMRVLISGPNEAAGVALFKATAGLEVDGEGLIVRPGAEQMLFLAEKPYLPPGTLREMMSPVLLEAGIADDQLVGLLRELDLEPVLEQAGGLDREQDWGSLLSLAEQQRLAFAHVLMRAPRFVFLDRAETALSLGQVRLILGVLTKHSVSYIAIAQDGEASDLYDAVLEIGWDGAWNWRRLQTAAEGARP